MVTTEKLIINHLCLGTDSSGHKLELPLTKADLPLHQMMKLRRASPKHLDSSWQKTRHNQHRNPTRSVRRYSTQFLQPRINVFTRLAKLVIACVTQRAHRKLHTIQ